MDMLVSTQSAAVTSEATSCGGAATASSDIGLGPEQSRMWLSSASANATTTRVRLIVDLVVRLLLPLVNGVSHGLHGLGLLGRNVLLTRRMLTNLLAAAAANRLSHQLSSSTQRIEPLLRMLKLRSEAAATTTPPPPPPCLSIHAATTETQPPSTPSQPPPSPQLRLGPSPVEAAERCVSLNVLAAPPPGTAIRADVVFIHGLHGSLVNTWKQGLWSSAGRSVPFQRPPRPPVRPPKRQRHSRGSSLSEAPPPRSKRPRFAPTSHSCPNSPSVSVERSLDAYCFASTFDVRCCGGNSSGSAEEGADDSWDSQGLPTLDSALGSSVEEEDDADGNSWRDSDQLAGAFPAVRLRDEVHRTESSVPDDHRDDHDDEEADAKERRLQTDDDRAIGEDDSGAGYSRCWPGDWLPLDCPGVRVIAVNYTTDPYLWRPLWIRKRQRTTLSERAREMSQLLAAEGVGCGRPIVWVGHSKGGIFIKQIMVDAWESGKAAMAPLWQSARGCLFYSVPHRGSPLADFNLPLVRQSVELVEIKKNCPGVLELHRRFVALYRSGHLRIQIFSFVETALTLMSVLYLRIVGIDSADPGIGEVCGVHLDHREICKPRDRNCILYTKLKKMINQVS